MASNRNVVKEQALTRQELRLMNIRERAAHNGVKTRYMSMGYWTPRSERKGRQR